MYKKNDNFVVIFEKKNSNATLLDSQNNIILKNVNTEFILINGYPYIGEKKISENWVKTQIKEENLSNLKKINGSFLIIFFDGNKLNVITDRFLSKKIFVSNNSKNVIVGTKLIQVSKLYFNYFPKNYDYVNKKAVFEFLFFRRLFGTDTLLKSIFIANPASLMISDKENFKEISYWTPKYQPFITAADAANQLAEKLKVASKSSKFINTKPVLLLSGGLDARALLASNVAKNCVTICPIENNESKVARELSVISNSSFNFFSTKKDALNNRFDEAVFLTDGEHSSISTTFLGYEEELLNIGNVFILGLYLDVLFGGLYLPKTPIKVGSYISEIYKLDKIKKDLPLYFMDKVKYKMKSSNIDVLFNENNYSDHYNFLYEKISNYFVKTSSMTDNIYSQWESLHLTPMSRHYSYGMISSIESFSNCFIPAFNNELLDLSFVISAKDKANSKVYKDAIGKNNYNLLEVINANINVSARKGEYISSTIILYRKLLKKFLKVNAKIPPRAEDRSWIKPNDYIAHNSDLEEKILNIKYSKIFNETNIFDIKMLNQTIEEHFLGKFDHSILLQHLVSIDSFYKQVFAD